MKKWIAALVVEDDALVWFDLAQTLEAEGYKTFEAADADEAMAVLEENSETDIQMPGTIEGLALSRSSASAGRPPLLGAGRPPLDIGAMHLLIVTQRDRMRRMQAPSAARISWTAEEPSAADTVGWMKPSTLLCSCPP
jgi:CheY-like chemotaxis protein